MTENTLPSLPAVKEIADLSARASEPTVLMIDTEGLGDGLPPEIPVIFDRKEQRAHSLKNLIEEHRQRPQRRKGTAKVTTLLSFIELVKRHKDDDSVIFATTVWPAPKLTAVIDYHTAAGDPQHGQHRIEYAFPITEELKGWRENDGKTMEQLVFAQFLEEHAPELDEADPDERSRFEPLFKERFANPNELIALSRSLEINVGAKVKRQERLASGERTVEFVEEHTNGKGEKVEIPGLFMLSVPAFLDGDRVRFPARLRYRVAGGSIMWFYQLYRADFWLREEVKSDLDKVGEETGLPTYEGAPEA